MSPTRASARTCPAGPSRQQSADGHELRFAVNYLAGYALIRRLLPLLLASAPSRIVQVSSAGQAPIDFDDVMLERSYSGVQAYCQSKLAQIMFALDLASELEGTGVTATALHPATYMPTKIVPTPASTLEEGVEATYRLAADPAHDETSPVPTSTGFARSVRTSRPTTPRPGAAWPSSARELTGV